MLEIDLEQRAGSTLPWGYRAYEPGTETRHFETFREAFDRFNGRLLLLGTPGCGKTTTLLHLASALVEEACADENAPIPLFFNLSTFRPKTPSDGNGVGKYAGWWLLSSRGDSHGFDDWLVDQIAGLRGAGVPRDVAREWVRSANVILLLDGLDEVNELLVRDVAAALNQTYLEPHPDTRVVVACRLIEYQPLEDSENTRLWLEGGVVLQPLTDDQIRAYLETAKATSLRDALPNDRVLMELARNPLTLSMMVLTYGGMDPRDLPSNLPLLERRRTLLDTYVDRMMQRQARRKANIPFDLDPRRDQPTPYGRARINRTLGWIAVRLSERSLTALPLSTLHSFLFRRSGLVQPAYWSSSTAVALLFAALLALLIVQGVQRHTESGPAVLVVPILLFGGWSLVWHYLSESSEAKRIRTSYAPEDQPWIFRACRRVTVTCSWILVVLSAELALGAVLIACADRLGFAEDLVRSLERDAGVAESRAVQTASSGIFVVGVALAAAALWFLEESVWRRLGRAVLAVMFGATTVLLMQHVQPDLSIAFSASAIVTAVVAVRGHVSDVPILGFSLSAAMITLVVVILFALSGALVGRLDVFDILVLSCGLGATAVFSDQEGVRAAGLTLTVATIAAAHVTSLENVIFVMAVGSLVFLFWEQRHLLPYLPGYWLDRIVGNSLQRLLLWITAAVPLRLTRFLHYCHQVMLLERRTGKYEFVHRLLRDHFAIRALVPGLSAASAEKRLRVIEQLSLQGESSFDALVDLTEHTDPEMRSAAAVGLGRIPSPASPEALVRILTEDRDPRVRAAVIEGSRPLADEPARELLEIGAVDPDANVRRAVIRALLTRHSVHFRDDYLAILQAALFDIDRAVTREVLKLLSRDLYFVGQIIPRTEFIAKWSQRVSVETLIGKIEPFVDDQQPAVRRICARILGHTRHQDALPILDRVQHDRNRAVRTAAVYAVGECGGTAAATRLLGSVRDRARQCARRHARGCQN